jgi:hypothetical protein
MSLWVRTASESIAMRPEAAGISNTLCACSCINTLVEATKLGVIVLEPATATTLSDAATHVTNSFRRHMILKISIGDTGVGASAVKYGTLTRVAAVGLKLFICFMSFSIFKKTRVEFSKNPILHVIYPQNPIIGEEDISLYILFCK